MTVLHRGAITTAPHAKELRPSKKFGAITYIICSINNRFTSKHPSPDTIPSAVEKAALRGENQCHTRNLQFRSPLSVCFPPSRRRRKRPSSSAPAIRTEKSRRRPVRMLRRIRNRVGRRLRPYAWDVNHQRDLHRPPARRGADVSEVIVEIYRVFPNDSDVGRTSGPRRSRRRMCRRASIRRPMSRSTPRSRPRLKFHDQRAGRDFTAANSVTPGGIHPIPDHHTGGNGPATGRGGAIHRNLHHPLPPPCGSLFLRAPGRTGRRRLPLAVGAETDRRAGDTVPARLHRPPKLDPR